MTHPLPSEVTISGLCLSHPVFLLPVVCPRAGLWALSGMAPRGSPLPTIAEPHPPGLNWTGPPPWSPLERQQDPLS